MKVRAKFVTEGGREGRMVGYYNHQRIREGQVFDLITVKGKDRDGNPVTFTPEMQFSKKWMEKVEAPAKGKTQPIAPVSEPEPAESSVDADVI